MQRPTTGPLWPPTDDSVENSLRRAYLRTPPLPSADQGIPDRFHALLDNLNNALQRTDLRPDLRPDLRQTA